MAELYLYFALPVPADGSEGVYDVYLSMGGRLGISASFSTLWRGVAGKATNRRVNAFYSSRFAQTARNHPVPADSSVAKAASMAYQTQHAVVA